MTFKEVSVVQVHTSMRPPRQGPTEATGMSTDRVVVTFVTV